MYLIASILKDIADDHPELKIDDEIADKAAWRSNVEKWRTRLTGRNAELCAAAHQSMLELIWWLDGTAHQIIDIALQKDTENLPQDAIDVGIGLNHWAACTEVQLGLEPGVAYLKELFQRLGTFLDDHLIKYLRPSMRGTRQSLSHSKRSRSGARADPS